MIKFRVYVHSSGTPTSSSLSSGHPRPRSDVVLSALSFNGWDHLGHFLDESSGPFKNRYLSDEDKEALAIIDCFCKKNALEYEVVDLGTMKFLARLGSRIRGIKTPTTCMGERMLRGVPSNDDLETLLRDQNHSTR